MGVLFPPQKSSEVVEHKEAAPFYWKSIDASWVSEITWILLGLKAMGGFYVFS